MALGKQSKKNVAAVRDAVFSRDQETCVIAGSIWQSLTPCAGGLTIQHRVGRGSGGSALYDAPNHLLAMCAIHNSLQTASSEFDKYCKRNGISVRRSIAKQWSMSRIPVRYYDGWYLLDGLNRYPVPDRTAEDLMEEIYGLE
jgi:hypothetical protein